MKAVDNHPEVDRISIWGIYIYKEYIRVLSKIIFYLLQEGYKLSASSPLRSSPSIVALEQ